MNKPAKKASSLGHAYESASDHISGHASDHATGHAAGLISGLVSRSGLWAILPFLLLVLLFEIAPLAGMVVSSFTEPGGGGFSLQNYLEVLQKPIYQAAVLNSLKISALASVIGIVIVFLTGLALFGGPEGTRRRFLSLLNMTSNFAGLPLAFAFITILGHSGVLVLIGKQLSFGPLAEFNLYSAMGLMMTYIYFQIPLGTMLLFPAFQGIRREWQESAALMGAGSRQFWRRVGIPVMLPSLADTFFVLFANALTAFATPYVLTGNSIPLLPLKISDMFVGDLRQRPELGGALSVTMLAIMAAVLLLCSQVKSLNRGGKSPGAPTGSPADRPANKASDRPTGRSSDKASGRPTGRSSDEAADKSEVSREVNHE